MRHRARPIVVLNSGGLDSLAVMLWARNQGYEIHSLAVDYGQRNATELIGASRIAEKLAAAHTTVTFTDLRAVANSAMTDSDMFLEDARIPGRAPNVIVPSRNLIFLSIAAAMLVQTRAKDIAVGFGGRVAPTPDQQLDFVRVFERTLNTGGCDHRQLEQDGTEVRIHTPLMSFLKADVLNLIEHSGGWSYIRDTVTCYEGRRSGCGTCLACKARIEGFAVYGRPDPSTIPDLEGMP